MLPMPRRADDEVRNCEVTGTAGHIVDASQPQFAG
jgi:hypothetical protein